MKPISSFSIRKHSFSTYSERPELEGEFLNVKQIHSAHITDGFSAKLGSIESDGIYIRFDQLKLKTSHKIHLAIKTADCLSVAVIGKKGAINLHAGWRGLAAEILFHPHVKECEPHTFVLSAAIAQENYEVGFEFNEIFKKFPQGLSLSDKKLTFSLHTTAIEMIKSKYPLSEIIVDKLDTFSNSQLNSFRRDQTKARNWNVLSLDLRSL